MIAAARPGKEMKMRRQMISKIGYDDGQARSEVLRSSKQAMHNLLGGLRKDNPGVSPESIRTVLSFAKLDYQNPDLPDAGFRMDITFEKRK